MLKNKIIMPAIGVSISAICIWYIIREIDFNNVITVLSGSNLLYAFPLLLCFVIYYWIKAIRWKYLLLPLKSTRTKDLICPMMLGFFANNILPAHLGELIRMYLGAKQLGIKNSQVLATIILERIFDILAVILLLYVAVISRSDLTDNIRYTGSIIAAIGIALLLSLIIFSLYTEISLTLTKKILFLLPENITQSILNQLEMGAKGLHSLHNFSLLVKIVFATLAQWAFMGLTIYFSFLAINLTLPFTASFLVLAFTVIAVIVPTAPGFFGTIQLAFVFSLKPYGVLESQALSASIYFHIFTYFSVVFYGFYLLHSIGKSVHDLKEGLHDN